MAIFDKVESQGNPREVLSRRISVCFCMVMATKTYVRLCLRLRRATVLAIHRQAAATAKSSSIFMLVYRYIFRVVSKSKPKKSKIT